MKSSPVSVAVYSPISRHQECCLSGQPTYDTVWRIDLVNPNERFIVRGDPVPVNEPILLEHCLTSKYLAADTLEFSNDFGIEYEVSVHNHSSLGKGQQLHLERSGKIMRGLPTKFQSEQNIWAFVASDDPSTDYKVVEVGKITYEDIVRMIRQQLLERGAYGVRRLSQIYKEMDVNGDHRLDPDDFRWGLYNYGIMISKEDTQLLVEACDRNKDGFIDFTEFLRFLRVTLSINA